MAASTARNITGAEYVEAMSRREPDRLARMAFQQRVLQSAPRGGSVLDFGAGPGVDARFYAEHGLDVAAYDVDPGMCEFFASHCHDLIGSGRVRLERGTYSEFLAAPLTADRRPELITANFAPLSLVSDLKSLFARFHARSTANAQVLASVLNPYFRGDLKYAWWWRNALRLWREGQYSVPGAQAPIVRRRLAEFAAQSAPYFELTRVYRGLPPRTAAESAGIDISHGTGHAWLHLTDCQFIFLLFSKRPTTKTP